MKTTIFKWSKRLLVLAVCSGVLGVAGFFLFRDVLMVKVIEKVRARVKDKYHATLAVEKAEMNGWNGFAVSGISLTPDSSSTLIRVDSIFGSVKLFSALSGDIITPELNIAGFHLTAVRDSAEDNFSFLFNSESGIKNAEVPKAGWNIKLENLIGLFVGHLPDNAELSGSDLSFTDNLATIKVEILSFGLEDEVFKGIIKPLGNNGAAEWVMSGTFDRENWDLKGGFRPAGGRGGKPFVLDRFEAAMGADEFIFGFSADPGNSILSLSGNISLKNAFVFQQRIATDTLRLQTFTATFRANVGENEISLDSSVSFMKINRVELKTFASLKRDTAYTIALGLKMRHMPAQFLFASLPEGAFEATRDIKAGGYLNYDLMFEVNTGRIDSLLFSSTLEGDHVKITQYGKTRLTMMNENFEYKAKEKGQVVRTFIVGDANPDFTALEQVSPYLRNALLTSEDGNFFYHKGFNESRFRESIIQNLKEKRFVRGGSTISMQLVKNVFLERKKTVTRKMEEALIVWLIENLRISSKERMYEVYLNVIEWGPGIYGIGEASRFYFAKKPSELNLNESIFLASIVPRPKGYKYCFDENGVLRDYVLDFYRVVSNFMVKKELITQREFEELDPAKLRVVSISR